MYPSAFSIRRKNKMAKVIDISSRITNELPMVKITDDIIVTVNNRKQTVLNIQAMQREYEKKVLEAEENGEDYNEISFINKALQMLVGESKAAAIEELNLPLPEYKLVYNTIMETVTGEADGTP